MLARSLSAVAQSVFLMSSIMHVVDPAEISVIRADGPVRLWFSVANDKGANGGLAGGSGCGTDARTARPSVLEVTVVPVLRIG